MDIYNGNLEHLYKTVASCFISTFTAMAALSRLEFKSLTIETEGKLERPESLSYATAEIILMPTLVIRHSRDLERATGILEAAVKQCLASDSIKAKVKLRLRVYHEQAATYPCPPV